MEKFDIWDGQIPGGQGEDGAPYLCYYPAENKTTSATVLIFAGGGYSHRSVHEGEGYAEKLNSWGMDAFVLEYRVAPVRFPFPLLDARRAMRFIRDRAKDFGINPEKIAVMGSSAGGHLAASAGILWDTPEVLAAMGDAPMGISRPDGMILSYPVISSGKWAHRGSIANLVGKSDYSEEEGEKFSLEKHVTPATPPMFIWHTVTDTCVPVRNATLLIDAYLENGLSFEHIRVVF